jgi:hypothetical protein
MRALRTIVASPTTMAFRAKISRQCNAAIVGHELECATIEWQEEERVHLLAAIQLVALLTSDAAIQATMRATMSIHADSINQKFTCAARVECTDIDNGTLYFDQGQAQDRYVLIDDTEPSRPNNPNGQ